MTVPLSLEWIFGVGFCVDIVGLRSVLVLNLGQVLPQGSVPFLFIYLIEFIGSDIG